MAYRFSGRNLVALAFAMATLLAPSAVSQSSEKEKDAAKEKGSANQDAERTVLRIEVTAGEKSVPVDSASVYVKFQQERLLAKDRTIEMNVKTNRDGAVKVPSVPRGKVLIQVLAPGWKTFGKWYDLTEAEHTIKINLQRPPRWY